MSVVGIDKDNITLQQAKKLRDAIKKTEKCPVLLWKTKHGFHFELVFKQQVSREKNFLLREKYDDCKERLRISHMRKEPYDILFTRKNGHFKKANNIIEP